jgi:hypothetical protein
MGWPNRPRGLARVRASPVGPGGPPALHQSLHPQAGQGHRAQLVLEEKLLALCRPFLNDPLAVQGKLCRRIERFIKELFVFVTDPAVPPENNAAERSLRHLVTSRKISGGTRSERGTSSKPALSLVEWMTLASLFGTWRARKLNPSWNAANYSLPLNSEHLPFYLPGCALPSLLWQFGAYLAAAAILGFAAPGYPGQISWFPVLRRAFPSAFPPWPLRAQWHPDVRTTGCWQRRCYIFNARHGFLSPCLASFQKISCDSCTKKCIPNIHVPVNRKFA